LVGERIPVTSSEYESLLRDFELHDGDKANSSLLLLHSIGDTSAIVDLTSSPSAIVFRCCSLAWHFKMRPFLLSALAVSVLAIPLQNQKSFGHSIKNGPLPAHTEVCTHYASHLPEIKQAINECYNCGMVCRLPLSSITAQPPPALCSNYTFLPFTLVNTLGL
jgi:hypothetical protein